MEKYEKIKKIDKIRKFIKEFSIGALWMTLVVNMFFWTYALKGMWYYGHFTMLEPNKWISGLEWIYAGILTIWVGMICTSKYKEALSNLFRRTE